MGRITISDVARDAGVSIATASFALNNVKGRVSEELRCKVLESAGKLGYTPNIFAQSLRSKNSNTIALIYEESYLQERNASTLQFVAGAVKHAGECGKDILIKLSGTGCDLEASMRKYAELSTSGRVDGLIFYCSIPDPKHLEQLKRKGVNFVVVPNEFRIHGFNTVYIDNAMAERKAVEYIYNKGYGEAYFLTLKHEQPNERELGFCKAVEEFGIKGKPLYYHSIFRGKNEIREVLNDIIEARNGRIAIACWNDIDAVNVLDFLHAREVKIPEEIGVIGFDDIPSSEYTNPPLTTVRQPFADMAALAVDLLLENSKDTGVPARNIEVPCTIVERGTI